MPGWPDLTRVIKNPFRFSRRSFLQGLPVLAGMSSALDRAIFAARPGAAPTFEQLPASKSGINWVHTAGRSPVKYLPETSGAGCAFLDYDNDGWMDIYLVNSGPSDFYQPAHPLR